MFIENITIETEIKTKNKSNFINPIIIVITNVNIEIFEIKILKITLSIFENEFFIKKNR